MLIRRGTGAEMLALWGGQGMMAESPTAQFFHRNIDTGNAEFWMLLEDGACLGEIYAFHALDDPDFADGADTAYLCAFSVRKDRRGQGLGTALITEVMARLKETGVTAVTIGVDAREKANLRLYRRLGFKHRIKDCDADPCMLDENFHPMPCPRFILLRRSL